MLQFHSFSFGAVIQLLKRDFFFFYGGQVEQAQLQM